MPIVDLDREFTVTGKILKAFLNLVILKCLPTGMIVEYYGSTIPNGWHLCDGTSGTPDLRDKFTITVGPDHPFKSTGTQTTKVIDDALIVSGSTTSIESGIAYYSIYRIMKL